MGKNGNGGRFVFLSTKISVDGDCCHEIKRCLLLGRKSMTNLGSIFKSRDITLLTNAHIVKAVVFPVVMYGCELDPKEVLELKNWCFQTLVLEKTPERPLDCSHCQRKSTPKTHWRDWCWNCSSHILAKICRKPIHWKRPWCWERLKAKEEGGGRGWDD